MNSSPLTSTFQRTKNERAYVDSKHDEIILNAEGVLFVDVFCCSKVGQFKDSTY